MKSLEIDTALALFFAVSFAAAAVAGILSW